MDKIMRFSVFVAVLFALFPAAAGNPPLQAALADKALGRTSAAVTIYEYSSLTCPHCRNFHLNTLPKLKRDYIDSGKVRLVYRDFPLDSLALAGAMLARCVGDQRYFGMIEALFRSQKAITGSDVPLDELERVGRFGGLAAKDVASCLDNEKLMVAIQSRAKAAGEKYKINSTPSFVIEGTVVRGNPAYADLRKIIDKALAAKK